MSWLSNAIGTSTPSAPQLPAFPTLQTPQLPQYPNFTGQQQNLLSQQTQNLGQYSNALAGYNSNPLVSGQAGIEQQQLNNYSAALNGQVTPNQALNQQQALAWQQTVQNAGNMGIRITGDTPGSAVSGSTAGNQMISDFNKTYGALQQNYVLGQQQLGAQENATSLQNLNAGLVSQGQAYNAYSGQATNLMNPLTQQQLGPYQQQTQQALQNANIANQNLMGQYGQATNQAYANYQQQLQGQQSTLGLLNGIATVGGQLGAGYLANPNNNPNTGTLNSQSNPYSTGGGLGLLGSSFMQNPYSIAAAF